MPDRLRLSLKKTPAMIVNRIAIGDLKLVYIACANKKLNYNKGYTPIVCIGTTENGISRVAASAAYRSEQILNRHGIVSFDIKIVTCGVRRHVKTWLKLERAFLLAFRERYGTIPLCNKQGKKYKETTEFRFFSRKRIKEILEALEKSGASGGHQISS